MQHLTVRNEKRCHLTTVFSAGRWGMRQDNPCRRFAVLIHTALASVLLVTPLACDIAHGQTPKNSDPIRVTCLDVYGQGERGIGPKNIQRCLWFITGLHIPDRQRRRHPQQCSCETSMC